jgi:hypothetical protein
MHHILSNAETFCFVYELPKFNAPFVNEKQFLKYCFVLLSQLICELIALKHCSASFRIIYEITIYWSESI